MPSAPCRDWDHEQQNFVNAGTGVLRILCIHASAIMIQTFLDED